MRNVNSKQFHRSDPGPRAIARRHFRKNQWEILLHFCTLVALIASALWTAPSWANSEKRDQSDILEIAAQIGTQSGPQVGIDSYYYPFKQNLSPQEYEDPEAIKRADYGENPPLMILKGKHYFRFNETDKDFIRYYVATCEFWENYYEISIWERDKWQKKSVTLREKRKHGLKNLGQQIKSAFKESGPLDWGHNGLYEFPREPELALQMSEMALLGPGGEYTTPFLTAISRVSKSRIPASFRDKLHSTQNIAANGVKNEALRAFWRKYREFKDCPMML